jgi:hypothetical protein
MEKTGGREVRKKMAEAKKEVNVNDPFGQESMTKLVEKIGPWQATILYQVISGKDVFTGKPVNAMENLSNALLAKISNHGYKG